MKISITGVAGFVGSSLADRLVAEGHEVSGVDNFETGRRENLNDAVKFYERDISKNFGAPFAPDLMIHCAASYKNHETWKHDTDTNINGAILVTEVARRYDARIFYFQTVLPPISSYAISKIAGEHYLRLSGQPLTVFRLASIYGPRNLSGAIPTFYRQIKAGQPCTVVEDATRDFVFIEDLVERVIQSFVYKDGVYDIRTGVETRIKDIPYLIADILGTHAQVNLVPRQQDDVPHYEMNGTPRVGTSFKEGLRKAVEWYEENGVAETFTHLSIG